MTFDSIFQAMNAIHGTPGEQEMEPIGRALAGAIDDVPENYSLFARDLSTFCGHDEFIPSIANEYEGDQIEDDGNVCRNGSGNSLSTAEVP